MGKPGIVADSIIRWTIQTMDRLAQFSSEDNAKHYNQKLLLDQCTGYFVLILEKTDKTNTTIILLIGDAYRK